jgi:hypothetical protein
MSDEVVYRSRVKIERVRGPIRNAWVPGREDPVTFGVHDEIAAHYGTDLGQFPPDATTLDYVVAAAGG